MAAAPDDEGSRRPGPIRRFLAGRRPAGESAPPEAATAVDARPGDEPATVVDARAHPGEAAEAPREPATRISPADDGRHHDEDATVVREGPVREADARTRADDTLVRPLPPGGTAGPAGATGPAPARGDDDRMRVPSFAPLAPVAGWLAAWGLAALAAQCFQEAGEGLGQGIGVASAEGAPDGLWNGIWLLAIQAVAWLFGGYVAARMARAHGTRHAFLAWALAMIATGADALTGVVRDGYTSVLAAIDIPSWIDTGLGDGARTAAVYAIFALVALVAALIGGAAGQGANALARRRARA